MRNTKKQMEILELKKVQWMKNFKTSLKELDRRMKMTEESVDMIIDQKKSILINTGKNVENKTASASCEAISKGN